MAKNKAAAHVGALSSALATAGANDLVLETPRLKSPAGKVLRIFKASGPTQADGITAGWYRLVIVNMGLAVPKGL
jgi:hypothetical protein